MKLEMFKALRTQTNLNIIMFRDSTFYKLLLWAGINQNHIKNKKHLLKIISAMLFYTMEHKKDVIII